MHIGIAGVGRMGANMGLRLMETGSKLTVWNRSADKVKPLVDAGAAAARTPAELVGAVEADRVLATILFTDIVDSTAKAVMSGDRNWRAILEAHHTAIRSQLHRHRGREVKTTGDGVLALFDGPARAVRSSPTCSRT